MIMVFSERAFEGKTLTKVQQEALEKALIARVQFYLAGVEVTHEMHSSIATLGLYPNELEALISRLASDSSLLAPSDIAPLLDRLNEDQREQYEALLGKEELEQNATPAINLTSVTDKRTLSY